MYILLIILFSSYAPTTETIKFGRNKTECFQAAEKLNKTHSNIHAECIPLGDPIKSLF